ncbi:Aste57867_20113 [Aphanomyces stellatus]|uniref:Aste57867_20113 protein n=1 Tax=Aphanomyces stellatus TaxID=120398 RepID=A0A485LG62_9STRA|nr:hypothetical protein As57867_020047 [Aphanomyces stellatus]VFT96808.1 Aste57867_20113 [Aphanomyces stellatus]
MDQGNAMERIQAAIKRQGNPMAPTSGGRKLLPWKEQDWAVYQKTPPFGGLVDGIAPVRPPLSTLYELHYNTSFKGGTPTDLMEALIEQAKRGKVCNIATVIDASANGLYYHDKMYVLSRAKHEEWDDWDVGYVKLPVDETDESTEAIPSKKLVHAFLQAVQRHFTSDRREEHIAVFGARGYNTAAFLIVCYLVELKNMALNDAIEHYKKANPIGIYSTPCLEALYKRYYSTLKPSGMRLLRSDRPEWDAAANDDSPAAVGADILTDEDKAAPFVRKQAQHVQAGPPPSASALPATAAASARPPAFQLPKATKKRKIRTWEDEVESFPCGDAVPVDSDEHRRLVAAVAEITGIPEGFPGCEAISLTKIHIRDNAYKTMGSLTKEYLVTWRARGTRCLILALKDANYLVSRRLTFTRINVKFPRKRAMHENTDKTLVDGVLVEDRDGDSVVLRYLAFDMDKALEGATESFRVRMKDHFRLEKTEHLLRNFIPKVTHAVEGLIFTPKNAVYGLGGFEADEPLFKFVVDSTAGMMGGLDGSLTEGQLLQYIKQCHK